VQKPGLNQIKLQPTYNTKKHKQQLQKLYVHNQNCI